jgi:hypothetical protein
MQVSIQTAVTTASAASYWMPRGLAHINVDRNNQVQVHALCVCI